GVRRAAQSQARRHRDGMKRLAVLLLVGCAHSRGESRRIEITEPTVITAGPPGQISLGEMDDATLFDVGTRAFQAGDFVKAAACFDRIAQPQPAAIWNAALSYERLGKLEEALLRYSKYIELKNEPEAQFRAALLDPAAMDGKALADALELKAEFLLSAQGHYLRCIRRGDGEWATAAGYRIGEMYEELYEQLINAPLPRGLDEQQSALYRQQ